MTMVGPLEPPSPHLECECRTRLPTRDGVTVMWNCLVAGADPTEGKDLPSAAHLRVTVLFPSVKKEKKKVGGATGRGRGEGKRKRRKGGEGDRAAVVRQRQKFAVMVAPAGRRCATAWPSSPPASVCIPLPWNSCQSGDGGGTVVATT